MEKPFPIRESSILSLAELVSRVLGLLFLVHFVQQVGLTESAAFRIILPLIGVAAALGSIGLPQALTRMFATVVGERNEVPAACLWTSFWAVLGAGVLTWGLLSGLTHLTAGDAVNRAELADVLQRTFPLLMLMCVTGSLRGILFGLGSTYAPAVAQVIEVGTRLFVLMQVIPYVGLQHGAQIGILTLTLGELAAGFLLAVVFSYQLYHRGISRKTPILLRDLGTVMRMSIAPTGQALLASLGYAMELPLAEYWLTATHGSALALQWVAEYSAVAIPLLCAPMVLTDGLATALLPHASAERASSGTRVFALQLRRTLGAVAIVSLPVTTALIVLAPMLADWFGTGSAATMLCLLAPLALPLYLQAPLCSLLQAQGRSRALLSAGLCGDAARIGCLWLGVTFLQLGRVGLALAFAGSVLVQTAILVLMAMRLAPTPLPWRTFRHAAGASLTAAALLLSGLHGPGPYLLWALLALVATLFHLLIAREISPSTIRRVPIVGPTLGRMSEYIVRFTTD